MENFRQISDPNVRMQKGINGLVSGGLTLSAARSVAAVASHESSSLYFMPREGTLPYDHECWPNRTLVGLEVLRGRNRATNAAVQLFRAKSANNLAVRNFLITRGLAADYPNGGQVVNTNNNAIVAGPKYLTPTGDMAGLGTTAHALFMEWIMMERVPVALEMVSIGPTMMWMGMAGEGVRAGTYGAKACEWPDTWDDIFQLYVADSWTRLAKYMKYLQPGCTGHSDYPADHPNDDVRNVGWLTKQTGSYGVQSYYNDYFKPALLRAITMK
jgi:hypothetical protein